jgi:tRNA-2-methylthio-N6-dimethylallyladenosine synthase
MKRGYTALEYKSTVRKLKRERPDLSLTSDFIVGFPGETDADFAQTMDLIDAIGFDGSFSFAYSPRPGTPAASLPDPVPHGVQQARLSVLQSRLDAQYRAYSEAMVGTRQRVLVTGAAARGEGELAGRTENNRAVNFPGAATLIGTYADVTITAARSHSLRGELSGAR